MDMRFILLILLFTTSATAQTPLHRLLKKTSSAPFSPTDIPDLAWYVKADGITGLSDGDPVSTWPDLSGNGNDLTQSGSNRPTWQTNELNGLPVVRLDGANDFFNLTSTIPAEAPYTFFIVYKKRTTGVGFPTLSSSLNTKPYTWFDYPNGDAYMVSSQGTNAFTGTGDVTTFTLITETAPSSSTHFAWKNGVSHSISSAAIGFESAPFNVVGYFPIGPVYADGDIAEMGFYTRELTTLERTNLQNGLISKYAL